MTLTLTGDQLRVLAACVGEGDAPFALATPHTHRTVHEREDALKQARRDLLARKLIRRGTAHPDVRDALSALQRPDRELTMRVAVQDRVARLRLARRGPLSVLVRGVDDDVSVRVIGHRVDPSATVAALLAELPLMEPARVQPVAAPTAALAECLSVQHDAVRLSDRIRCLGTAPESATLLGAALASGRGFAEIVYAALIEDQDRIVRTPGAVAVYYTGRGRIVATPSASPTGEPWVTLKPGSDHAIARAVEALIELSDHPWAFE